MRPCISNGAHSPESDVLGRAAALGTAGLGLELHGRERDLHWGKEVDRRRGACSFFP